MAMKLTPDIERIRKWSPRRSLVWIGKKLKVSPRTVARFCDKYQIPYKKNTPRGPGERRPEPKWKPEDTDRLIEMKNVGMSVAAIAAEMKRSQRGIESKLFYMGMGSWERSEPVDRRRPEEAFAAAMRGRLYDIRATPDAGGPRLPRVMTVVESASSADFL